MEEVKKKVDELKIDDDFKNLLPELDVETYTALEKDIIINGMISPIVTWHGYIVDGHNRIQICKAHHILEVQTRELKCETKSEAMQWEYDHQFARRNLKKSEIIIALKMVKKQVAKDAKERQRQAGGDKVSDKAKAVGSNLNQAVEEKKRALKTDVIMAKKVGVSTNTYRNMELIVDEGTPDQIARMDRGGKDTINGVKRSNAISVIAREIIDKVPDGMKKCKICGKIKPLKEFNNSHSPYYCASCEKKRKKESYEKSIQKASDILGITKAVDAIKNGTGQIDISPNVEIRFLIDNFKSSLQRMKDENKVFDNEAIDMLDELIGYIEKTKEEVNNGTNEK